jgi:multiple sugar transport system permease protein
MSSSLRIAAHRRAPATTRAAPAGRRTRRLDQEWVSAALFMAPAVIVFLIFLIAPVLFTLVISLTDWDGITPVAQRAEAASGLIALTNPTAEAVALPPDTALVATSPDGQPVELRTTAPVIASAGSAGTEVPVRVDEASGRRGNLPAGTELRVVEGPGVVLEATNPVTFTGGRDQAFTFIGMENFRSLTIDEGLARTDFMRALRNTSYYVLGVVPLQTILALLLAVLVNQRWIRGRGFFRTAYYFPSVTSSVVISLIFMFLFTRGGIVNGAINAVFPGYRAIDWLNDPSGLFHLVLARLGVDQANVGGWASTSVGGLPLWEWLSGPSVTMSMIMLLNVWTTVGTFMVIYLAALQNVPESVYEAASIDGASTSEVLRHITMPLLRPTTFLVVTMGLISTFQVFDQIFVISSGGPAKTTVTIAYIVYQNAFQNSRMGLASATAFLLLLLISLFAAVQRRITSDRAA